MRLVLVGERLHRDDGAEDLVLDRLVVLAQAGEDGGLEEVAVAEVRTPVAAGRHRRVGRAGLDEAGSPAASWRGVVDRAEERRPRRRAGPTGAEPLAYSASAATKSSWMPGGDEDAGGGRAVLAGVEVAGDRDALDGGLDVGVVEDHDRRLAAELEVHPLDLRARRWRPPRRPARTDPVMATSSGVGCSTRRRPVSRSPVTTLSVPGGRNSEASSASRSVLSGVVSLGLRTTVLPAARAGPIFHTAISSG